MLRQFNSKRIRFLLFFWIGGLVGFAMDFSSIPKNTILPELQTFVARDGDTLSYRSYGSNAQNLIVLLHGSGSHGGYLQFMACELARDATVFVPTCRGHYKSGSMRGTCSYVGQLEDDLADFLKHIESKKYANIVMIGHSSGASLAIRFSGGNYGSLISKYVLLAPIIPAVSGLQKRAAGWAKPNMFKIAPLMLGNFFGMTWFNDSSVISFNMPQEYRDGTETLDYSYNLLFSMNPRFDYQKDLESIDGRSIVIVGRDDECLNGAEYKKLFKKSPIHIIEEVNHFLVVRDERVIHNIREFCAQLRV